MNFKDYFRELQRRHVVKAGIAYLVVAWLLVQVLDILFDAFEIGTGWMQTIIIILSVGFPIWLIIAWVYDFTPEGIKKTEDMEYDSKVSAKKNLQLNRLIIGGLSIAVILLVVNQVRMTSSMEESLAEASILPDFTSSIAVLAFDDMSPDKDQEYFSDGISEEILNRLAKYRDLKVISRTSSFAYKGKNVTIDVIGEELDVAYVLEGSVRKSGDTFRTTVQLIDTRDGAHIWSDTFDRKIEDALQVQDEIAGIVAERLKLTLLNEDVRLRKVDPEAYELYLQASYEFSHWQDSTSVIADSLIRISLEIDPNYSNSWSLFSANTLHFGLYNNHLNKNEAVSIGIDAARKAIALDSNNVYAWSWLSNWQWHARQGEASLKTLQMMLTKYPNNFHPHGYGSHAFKRMGMPEKALEQAYISYDLDPKDLNAPQSIALSENYRENYAQGIPFYEKFMEERVQLTGSLRGSGIENLVLMYYRNGEKEKAFEALEKVPLPFFKLARKTIIEYNEGNNTEADSLLREFMAIPELEIQKAQRFESANLDFELARIYIAKGDIDIAFEHLDKAYDYLLETTEVLWYFPEFKKLHDNPRWEQLLGQLGEEFNFDYNTSH